MHNPHKDSQSAWNEEYRDPRLLTLGDKPLKEVVDFFRFLKKQKISIENANVLDVGCGTGRNSIYASEFGANVYGIDISKEAILLATERAKARNEVIDFRIGNIANGLPYNDSYFDIVIDTMVNHLLRSTERAKYITELERVMKPRSFLFVKTLSKEGDMNAKMLIKQFPGRESDSYIMPGIGVEEKVITEGDFKAEFEKDGVFEVLSLKREAGYPKFEGRIYKRMFLSAIIRRK